MSLKMLQALAALVACIGIVGALAVTALATPPNRQTQTVCSSDRTVCAAWPNTLASGSRFVLNSTFTNTSPTSPLTFFMTNSVGQLLDRVQHVTPGHTHDMKTTLQAPVSGCMSLNYYDDFARPLPTGGGVYVLTAQICV